MSENSWFARRNCMKRLELAKDKKKFISLCLLIVVCVLFGITRFWQLGKVPFGLHLDEAGAVYDAWCLSEYGVDRYLKSWPIYLINKGDGSSILGIYLCAGLFKLFGCSTYLARLLAVLFSFLNLLFGVKIARKMYPKSEFMPIVAGILITICPYFIMSGRFFYDCNFMLGASTIFLYTFCTAVESAKISYYALAGITGGIMLYTYALSYLILPLFLVTALLYLIRVGRFSLRGWIVMAIPLGIMAFPLILVQIVNIFDLDEFRIGIFTITKIPNYRGSEIKEFQFDNLLRVIHSLFLGEADLQYNTAPGRTNIYGITMVFLVMGLDIGIRSFIKNIKNREFAMLDFVLLWFVVIVFFESRITPNVNRLNGIFSSIVLLATLGIYALRRMSKSFRYMAFFVVGCIYVFCFVDFAAYYYGGDYALETAYMPLFDTPVTEAVEFIEEDEELCQKITQMVESEIYYAVSTWIPPQRFAIGERDEHTFENYRFGTLGEIEDGCNYIVRDGFEQYCEKLRQAGFMEVRYEGYSLFYKK